MDHFRNIGLWARSLQGWIVIGGAVFSLLAPLYAFLKGLSGPVIFDIWLGAVAALMLIVAAVLSVIDRIASARFRRKPAYDRWDKVSWPADWQAACLWDDVEPYSPLADRTPSYPTLQMLKSAAIDGLLVGAKTYEGESWTRFSRDALRNFARSKEIRPLAFFPEIRSEGRRAEALKTFQISASIPMQTTIIAPSLDQYFYVGRIETGIAKLLSDYRINFDVIGFNGSPYPFVVSGVHGAMRFKLDGQSTFLKLEPAQFLKLHWTSPVKPYGEFAIELVQAVSGIVANDISDAFSRGTKAEFELLELDISVRAADDEKIKGRLPLWPGLFCAKFGERVITNKIIYATGRTTIAVTGNATLSLGE